jgi:hypothetical protein
MENGELYVLLEITNHLQKEYVRISDIRMESGKPLMMQKL